MKLLGERRRLAASHQNQVLTHQSLVRSLRILTVLSLIQENQKRVYLVNFSTINTNHIIHSDNYNIFTYYAKVHRSCFCFDLHPGIVHTHYGRPILPQRSQKSRFSTLKHLSNKHTNFVLLSYCCIHK